MPKYQYNVINQENKGLSGTISAPDEQAARAELNQLGFSVIGVTQIPEEQTTVVSTEEAGMPTFEFAGIDKGQKRVVGTIQAEDRLGAYKRLISEYAFEVEYLVDQSLPEEQKKAEKIKGIYELQNKIDEEALLVQKKQQGDSQDLKEFEKKQEALKGQVEFVLKKVKEMLDLYENEMKLETKAEIHKYVDKILRIKSSTNLDYIRKSCEELLAFLQKEELFLNESLRMKERTQMVLEAKSMMMQLHSAKSKTTMSFHETLTQWREEHINGKEYPSSFEKLLNFFVSLMIGFVPENEKIKEIQHNIAIVNQQIKQYWVLYFQAATPDFKKEAQTSLKKLRQERKRLKKELQAAKKNYLSEYKQRIDVTSLESFSRELLTFTGWLLAFYLIYYFISIYLNTKQFGDFQIGQPAPVYKTTFLKYFLTTLFLFHSALSVKIHFFRRNDIATLVITPVFFLASLLVILNF